MSVNEIISMCVKMAKNSEKPLQKLTECFLEHGIDSTEGLIRTILDYDDELSGNSLFKKVVYNYRGEEKC